MLRNHTKRIILLLVISLFFSVLIFAGPNENAGIRFDLDATTYGNQNDTTMAAPSVGDYIRLDVYAIDVHNLDTYEFEVIYNHNQLDFITATPTNPITYEPNILTTNGGTALGWMIDISTPGVLSIAYTLTGTDTLEAPEGEGLIADIVFQALTTTQGFLTFGDVYYHDSFDVIDFITDKGIAILFECGNVAGTVTGSDTGEPIEGAIVSIENASDSTGSNGTYFLEFIPVGIHDITCTSEGYYDAADVVEVLDGQTVTYDFVLEPQYGNLDGTVTSSTTGEPIEGALITATSQGRVEYTGFTDADGYYIIDSMLVSELVGNYTVTCDAGDTYLLGEETDVVIESGDTTTVDFVLAPPIVWEYSGNLVGPIDADRLPNGNTLITDFFGGCVIEVTTDGTTVWQYWYSSMFGTDAERLPNGNTLIATCCNPDRIIEVTPEGTIVWQYTNVSSPYDVERLSNGNTLITDYDYDNNHIFDVTPDGTIVWEYQPNCYNVMDAERLPNGNTLISTGCGVIEVTPDGTIVWEYTNVSLANAAERLINGNTLIADNYNHRVIEVTPDSTIVWEYNINGSAYPAYPYDVECLPNNNILIAEIDSGRVIEVYRPAITDTIPPYVTVDIPNGGEVWTVGQSHQIQWYADDNIAICSDSVFYSTDNGVNWVFIEAHLGNPQTCTWTIPDTPSEQCLVKVVVYDWGGNSASDESDAVFTIETDTSPPTVEVIVPNGGEIWEASEQVTITWVADDNVDVVCDSIYYSINNGVDWIFITSHTGNPQTYSWQVPNTPSDQCLVKVKVFDANDNCAEDISDAVFTIETDTPPTVEVIVPNGSESWGTFEWHIITWTADDNAGIACDSVYYSINDGVDWIFIASHTGNPQTHYWQVPNTPSDQCLVKVKVVDLGENCAEDISDGNFTIFYQEPPPLTYAVVIKQSTYNNLDWQVVADELIARYQGQLFIWNSSLNEVQNDVATFQPTHIGFVCELSTASPGFVQNSVWPFTRALDSDVYCDAVWGIITGYNAEDALNLVTGPTGFDVKTVLGGTGSCDLSYYTQGIGTSECTYGEYYVKNPDSLETTTHTDGPTDRTEWLVTMINEGIDIFNYDPVDIFYTSGHANYNEWQLHYPSSGLEGYFWSSNGQVYGDPYTGSNININSDNPKIYFGLGNCYIGKIINGSCMAPSWIHTGGAYQYTGYVIPEGITSHQHGGTKAYFYRVARNYTWAESFFLANIALKFDMINGTPGAVPPDLNGSALYGDPGMQVKMSNEGIFQQPLFTSELFINEGTEKDTVTFKITMNRQGKPGYDGKWGNRHPAIILPFRVEDVEIIYTNAMAVVVEDNFALMYIWHQGQYPLAQGETREVVFTCNSLVGVDEPIIPSEFAKVVLYQNYPNPFSGVRGKSGNPQTTISYTLPKSTKVSLSIYNIKGQLVETLVDEVQQAGYYSVIWNGKNDKNEGVSSGIYFYRITAGDFTDTKKCIILK